MLESLNKINVKNIVLENPQRNEFDMDIVRQDFRDLSAREFSFPTWSDELSEEVNENQYRIAPNLLGTLLLFKFGDPRAKNTYEALKKGPCYKNGQWISNANSTAKNAEYFLLSSLIEHHICPMTQSLEELKKSIHYSKLSDLWTGNVTVREGIDIPIYTIEYFKDSLLSLYLLSLFDKEGAREKFIERKSPDRLDEKSGLWSMGDSPVDPNSNLYGVIAQAQFDHNSALKLYKNLKKTDAYSSGKWRRLNDPTYSTKFLTEDALLDIWARYEIGSRLPQSLLNPVPPYPPLERV